MFISGLARRWSPSSLRLFSPIRVAYASTKASRPKKPKSTTEIPPIEDWRSLFPATREKRVLLYNQGTAAAFAKEILSGNSSNAPKIIIEAFPGPGVLTRELLEYPESVVKKIIVLEENPAYFPYLKHLQKKDPRVVFVEKSGFFWSTYRDMEDQGMLNDIVTHPWEEVHPNLQFVAQLPSANIGEQLTAQLVRYISDRSWLYKYGRLRMDFLMTDSLYKRLTSLPGTNQRCKLSVITEANAEVSYALDPERLHPVESHLFPKPSMLRAVPKSGPQPYCACTITPRPETIISGNRLDHWDFVLRKLFVLKCNPLSKAITTLAPGATNILPLLQREDRYVDTSKFVRDLTNEDWRRLMEAFLEWPFAPDMLFIHEKINTRNLSTHQR